MYGVGCIEFKFTVIGPKGSKREQILSEVASHDSIPWILASVWVACDTSSYTPCTASKVEDIHGLRFNTIMISRCLTSSPSCAAVARTFKYRYDRFQGFWGYLLNVQCQKLESEWFRWGVFTLLPCGSMGINNPILMLWIIIDLFSSKSSLARFSSSATAEDLE